MRPHLLALLMVAALSAVLGVGYAISGLQDQPQGLPNLDEPTLLADKNGNALRCAGKKVKVDRKRLRAALLPGPTEKGQRMPNTPSFESFGCARDAKGRETGDVTVQSSRNGSVEIAIIPAQAAGE